VPSHGHSIKARVVIYFTYKEGKLLNIDIPAPALCYTQAEKDDTIFTTPYHPGKFTPSGNRNPAYHGNILYTNGIIPCKRP
jgi:hypothetical protein